eukprot:jgi/Tetstr1/445314/TSEL_033112.t1
MFKALFVGYLFGVRPERQVLREIEVNVAYRWVLRLKPADTTALGMMPRKQFADEGAVDGHRCPDGQMPASATTERNGYRHYNSGPAVCKACPRLASCTSNARAQRTPPVLSGPLTRDRVDAKQLHRHRTHGFDVCGWCRCNASSPPPLKTSRRSQWR